MRERLFSPRMEITCKSTIANKQNLIVYLKNEGQRVDKIETSSLLKFLQNIYNIVLHCKYTYTIDWDTND